MASKKESIDKYMHLSKQFGRSKKKFNHSSARNHYLWKITHKKWAPDQEPICSLDIEK